MRIKRIHAATMQDALEQVRAELGPDAVIVSTRPLGTTAEDRRRGLRGVEIVAGLDEQPMSAVAQARSVAASAPSVAPGAARAAYTLSMGGAPASVAGVRARKVEAATRTPEFPRLGRNGEPAGDDLDAMVPALEALAARGRAAQPQPAATGAAARSAEEHRLLDLIRSRHDEFVSIPPSRPHRVDTAAIPPAVVRTSLDAAPAAPAPDLVPARAPSSNRPSYHMDAVSWPGSSTGVGGRQPAASAHAAAEAAFTALAEIGLSEPLAERAIETAITRLARTDLHDTGRLLEIGLASLVAGIPVLELSARALAGRTLAFVGPAGAGKTTALLKTAVQLRRDGADVAIIAADVSRIGAADQLRRYGDVLRLPVSVVYAPEEAAATLNESPPGRITLMDTPAGQFGREGFAPEVAALVGAVASPLVVLTVPAGASDTDLRRWHAAAAATAVDALAITKLDEAGGAAPVLNVLATLRLPALLLSTGRDVTGDIEMAGAAAVAGAVLDELTEQVATAA